MIPSCPTIIFRNDSSRFFRDDSLRFFEMIPPTQFRKQAKPGRDQIMAHAGSLKLSQRGPDPVTCLQKRTKKVSIEN